MQSELILTEHKYVFNVIDGNDLVMPQAKASEAMILTSFAQNNPAIIRSNICPFFTNWKHDHDWYPFWAKYEIIHIHAHKWMNKKSQMLLKIKSDTSVMHKCCDVFFA